MICGIRALLDKFEDLERPLLGPNVKWLKIWGLLLPQNKLKKYMYMTFHTLMFLFIFTEFMDLWSNKCNITQLLRSMKYAMLSTVNVSKIVSFFVWKNYWISIIKYVSDKDLASRKSRDRKSREIIKKYTKHCRSITYWYCFLALSTVAMTILQPVIQYIISKYENIEYNDNNENKYIQVVNSWLPIDSNTLFGYSVKVSFQIFATVYAGGWISSFDTNAIGIIIFLKGESQLLRNATKYLFGTEENPNTIIEATETLREIHKRHNALIKYSRLFDSCLSPIMLLYVIVCSVMLCATAYQITFETSAFQKLITAEYLIFGVSQLFMYCWHSNEVFYVSKDLPLGPYESIWWTRSLSEQSNIKILTYQFNKSIVFSAGPFTVITVATFISILKGAYSYYTLLSQSQET